MISIKNFEYAELILGMIGFISAIIERDRDEIPFQGTSWMLFLKIMKMIYRCIQNTNK